MSGIAVCADVGSTYTKVAVVDLDSGTLVATAAHPTTVRTDVLDGLDAAVAAAGGTGHPLYVCSSAGGGLRLAVVGYERLVTARAGQQVGLTAGARVVHVAAGRLDGPGMAALRAARPDVLLLVGGTDGGDAETLLHNASRLAGGRLRVPVVVAGNADARAAAKAILADSGIPVSTADNVLPRIGVLNPGPARAGIRQVFLRHVIGGKRLSRGTRFASLVRGATPDVVLTGVELLADQTGTDLVVLDIGGATTDVYSVLTPAGEQATVAGTLWRSRTVEGDLGVRWSATGVVEAALGERLLDPAAAAPLTAAAQRRAADPDLLPGDEAERQVDARLAELAATVALRRHGRERDLRDVQLVIGSGGVLRHGSADRVLAAPLSDHAGGWPLPRAAIAVVDRDYVLAPAGLLAPEYPDAALALLRSRLPNVPAFSQ
ncbi:MAG: glutamate mutase [Actinobacteria bacterium 13_1_20CM_3_71_11]|nr:MAG: glutamate mutase [Actinobacteria bacterium 13_1_20CM_3_71_11]